MQTTQDGVHNSQLLDEHMEKASLDSRDSTEASNSVSSGDVATGNLVDLTIVTGTPGYSTL